MTLRELYNQAGGCYDEMKARMGGDKGVERLSRFIHMLPADPSMNELSTALKEKDYEAAFRAVHTYKGVTMNLGLDGLAQEAQNLTEALRDRKEKPEIVYYFEKLERMHQIVLSNIAGLTK